MGDLRHTNSDFASRSGWKCAKCDKIWDGMVAGMKCPNCGGRLDPHCPDDKNKGLWAMDGMSV
jgi:hypothetical protein